MAQLRPLTFILTAVLAGPALAPAAQAHSVTPGYVTTANGQAVETTDGSCVRTDSPSHSVPDACRPVERPVAAVPSTPPPPPAPEAQAAPAPAPTPVAPQYAIVEQALAHHKAVVTADSEFAFDSAHLRAQAFSTLNAVADYVARHPHARLRVDGYTDSIGTQKYNLKLSQRRAEAVAHYLEQKGVPAAALKVTGHGKHHPVASNKTAAGRAKNRRVEVRVRGQGQASDSQ